MTAAPAARISAALGIALGLLAAGAAPAAPLYRPAASSADPRDLSGVWWLRKYNRIIPTVDGTPPPFTEKGKLEWAKRILAEANGVPMADASSHCWPHGTPRVMNSPYPLQIFQTPQEVIIAHEVAHNTRFIHMQREHPAQIKTSFMGDSVGHWEGDTLVIDTLGVDDRTWIDEQGIIHSNKLHTVERIKKIENGMAIEDVVTVEDPVYFTKPWKFRDTYAWRPDTRLTEYSCEENNRNAPQNGVTVAR
ncbi:MAG: hypothetical protein WDN45_08480 [Caulobacteraceae bacterium]